MPVTPVLQQMQFLSAPAEGAGGQSSTALRSAASAPQCNVAKVLLCLFIHLNKDTSDWSIRITAGVFWRTRKPAAAFHCPPTHFLSCSWSKQSLHIFSCVTSVSSGLTDPMNHNPDLWLGEGSRCKSFLMQHPIYPGSGARLGGNWFVAPCGWFWLNKNTHDLLHRAHPKNINYLCPAGSASQFHQVMLILCSWLIINTIIKRVSSADRHRGLQ